LETVDYLKEGDVDFKKPKVGVTFNIITRNIHLISYFKQDKEEEAIPTSSR
jgi:hypothetical protein